MTPINWKEGTTQQKLFIVIQLFLITVVVPISIITFWVAKEVSKWAAIIWVVIALEWMVMYLLLSLQMFDFRKYYHKVGVILLELMKHKIETDTGEKIAKMSVEVLGEKLDLKKEGGDGQPN